MIPEEAVKAAHRAWREQAALDGSIFEYNLRAALEAAAPHMAAQALEDAVDAFPLETIVAPDNAVVWMMRRSEALRGDA
ncbi:hypothetical protein ACFC25_04140 [Pseudarthrobacter sp. NPDC055928]|uniref:hypothetical protein n=1 Tax=Pseudarthrobacter sp. NPDC055928 TaxID=3345661 RepID=UPI0035E11325